MKAEQIGTVEVLIDRDYPIDPTNRNPNLGMDALVSPGIYPLYKFDSTRFWMMTGNINARNIRLGDGMFTASSFDDPIKGVQVQFPSPFYGENEWTDLLKHPICAVGDPEHRLTITVY